MGFGASNDLRDATPQEPLGVDPKRTSTNEQGRPLPYFAGIAKYDYVGIGKRIDTTSAISFTVIRFGVDNIPNTTDLIDNKLV